MKLSAFYAMHGIIWMWKLKLSWNNSIWKLSDITWTNIHNETYPNLDKVESKKS